MQPNKKGPNGGSVERCLVDCMEVNKEIAKILVKFEHNY